MVRQSRTSLLLVRGLRYILVAVGLCWLVGSSGHVSALGTTRFKVYPTTYDKMVPASRSWFLYTLGRGQAKDGSLTIVSTAPTAITVQLTPVDATTTKEGAFALLDNDEPRRGVGAWVKLSQSRLTLEPNQSVDVPFRLTIPSNAGVGDHLGGIAVQETTPTARKVVDGAAVNVISRVGTRIYETVPGKQHVQLTITDFKRTIAADNRQAFSLTLHNSGNVELKPQASLTMSGLLSRKVTSAELTSLGSIAPDRQATYAKQLVLRSRLLPDRMAAEVTVHYGSGQVVSRQLHFMAFSWYNLLLPGIIVAAVGTIIQLRRRFTIQRR